MKPLTKGETSEETKVAEQRREENRIFFRRLESLRDTRERAEEVIEKRRALNRYRGET